MHRRTLLLAGSLFAAAAAGGEKAVAAPETSFKVDGHVALHAYQGMVEAHLTDVLTTIRALAATSDAQGASWPAIRPALERLGGDLATGAAIWFALPDGAYNSTQGVSADASLADRDYFPALIGGHDVVGRLVISKSTGHRSIIVATPVTRDGRVVGAIGVSDRARLVSRLVIDRMRLPPDLSFYALDVAGQAAIHLDPDRMFQSPAELGEPSLKAAVATMLSRPNGAVTYRFQGKTKTALFERSDLTGWRFVLTRTRG
ncbi:MAG: hypothetical protein P4L64_12800 [Caulobacteraceae bacterium]|nr:hypothetical protein [Caulobacteraceae bacterium]